MSAVKIKLTQITSLDCEMTKTFQIVDNELTSSAIAHMTKGVARVIEISDVTRLVELLPLLEKNQAITCGIPQVGDSPLTTRSGAGFNTNAVARTNETFHFPNGPAIFPLDIDIDAQHATFMTVADALDAAETCSPWLKHVLRIARPSSSSFVGGRGLRGVHIYFAVTNGTDIAQLGARMQLEQWEKNRGWVKISKSGALLVRQLSDATIYQPSRLMFEAAPVCADGVTRVVPEDQLFVVRAPDLLGPAKYKTESGMLDVSALPPVRDIAWRRFETQVSQAKSSRRKQAKVIALNYHKELAIANGLSVEEGERLGLIAIRALGDEKLPTDWPIFVRDKGVLIVAQVLKDLDTYIGSPCADPFDSLRIDLTPKHLNKGEIVMMHDTPGVWSHKMQRFFAFTEEASANVGTPLERAAEKLCGLLEFPEPPGKGGASELNVTHALSLLLRDADIPLKFNEAIGVADTSDMPSTVELQYALARVGCYRVSKSVLKDVLDNLARTSGFDPWKERILALPVWDKRTRLDTFFSDVFGALDCDALRRTAQLLFAGIVMRQLFPGAPCSVVPVLIGTQNAGKTNFIRQLAASLDFPRPGRIVFGDDRKMSMVGEVSALVEIAELSGLSTMDIEAVKAWVSDTEDVYRAPFGHKAERHPRRFVPIGTSNKYTFNVDPTGNRRFMPVHILSSIDKQWVLEAEQIFAEAKARFCASMDDYLQLLNNCSESVKAFNREAMERGEGMPETDLDDLMPPILNKLLRASTTRRISSLDIRTHLDGLASGKPLRAATIANWLQSRGWRKGQDGKGLRYYEAPDNLVDEQDTNHLSLVVNPFTKIAQ